MPSGKTKLHHVNANGNPRRATRTVAAAAITTHSRANPHVVVPYRTANAFWPGSTATPASRLAAVIDWPSGPSTIHSAGTASPGPCWTSRCQICGTRHTVANRLTPNSA
ncbi:hypothetical protein BBK82_33050 [Lentzea guizhouensis]|uniref:Uncharacterized protein n=1 Tax=Lentzea guizhouensis TaxID=1586287 RepID=A0A1B2HR05_9PSEU|nr:hypothetical protein BBK82_33050 [Lentzea guizhouensis]